MRDPAERSVLGMKKKIFALAIIAICLSIVAYGTVAYFTYEETVTNVITLADVEFELHKYSEDEFGIQKPAVHEMDVVPGRNVSNVVQVENTGSHAAWIRISIRKALELAAGQTGEVDLSLVLLDLNTEQWIEKDGYYYYYQMLQPGMITEPLYTNVTFSWEMDNRYQNSTAYVTVITHAVQATNNGTTVLEAAGWPEEA